MRDEKHAVGQASPDVRATTRPSQRSRASLRRFTFASAAGTVISPRSIATPPSQVSVTGRA